ncbi:hypothetical protein EK904_004903 [Melospiza melodia maxima]|nr:hypothetical protein EK904_004903 [Melospiza melodia maxima]
MLKVLTSFKSSEIEQAVNSLDRNGVDLLMKYIYKGFEKPTENSSAILLQWHEKAERRHTPASYTASEQVWWCKLPCVLLSPKVAVSRLSPAAEGGRRALGTAAERRTHSWIHGCPPAPLAGLPALWHQGAAAWGAPAPPSPRFHQLLKVQQQLVLVGGDFGSTVAQLIVTQLPGRGLGGTAGTPILTLGKARQAAFLCPESLDCSTLEQQLESASQGTELAALLP